MRVIIAAVLGGIAMFIVTSILHVMPHGPGRIGFSQIPDEQGVLSTMQGSMKQPGLYFFPWIDPDAPDATKKSAELQKENPSGLIVYHPAGSVSSDMVPLMIKEFAKEFLMALIAAWLMTYAYFVTYWGRVGFVTLIGVSGALSTNVSYLIWYGFPLAYTLANMGIEIVGAFAAGLAIAWWFNRAPRTD